MTRPIRTTEPASDEFSEAVRWYEARRSGLGSEFFNAVAATLSLNRNQPGNRHDDFGRRSNPSCLGDQVSVPSRLPTQTHRDGDCGHRPPEAASGILEESKLIVESAQRSGSATARSAGRCKRLLRGGSSDRPLK